MRRGFEVLEQLVKISLNTAANNQSIRSSPAPLSIGQLSRWTLKLQLFSFGLPLVVLVGSWERKANPARQSTSRWDKGVGRSAGPAGSRPSWGRRSRSALCWTDLGTTWSGMGIKVPKSLHFVTHTSSSISCCFPTLTVFNNRGSLYKENSYLVWKSPHRS